MKLRSWLERLNDLDCPDCRRRVEHRRRVQQQLEVIGPEPTQEEIDSWLIPEGEA